MAQNRPSPEQWLDAVLDPGSWRPWEPAPAPDPPGVDPDYARDLRLARERTGWDESVRAGEGSVHGHRVAVVLSHFGFLAGSIGVAAGQRLVRAVRRATAERLPLLAAPASGGTRMQEGTTAFLQMAAVTTALQEHRAAALPFLVHLRHPTTGGVLASWGSLGHVTAAEPGALIGFLGPRVHEALRGEPFPPGVQTAENLRDHGLVDAVLRPAELRELAARVLSVATGVEDAAPPGTAPPGTAPDGTAPDGRGRDGTGRGATVREAAGLPVPDAADALRRSRRVDRPGVRELLRHACTDVTVLHATGSGERDEAMAVALARLHGVPCVLVGQDRVHQRRRALHPAGLRAARRGMRLAAGLRLPLVTVIDTPGAELSRFAEETGLAGEIARCLDDLLALPVPTVSVLLGEGAGGAALALFPADRTLAARHAWLSPLPPEGASAILHRTTDRAAELAARQHVLSRDLLERGAVDGVVPELPDAADEPAAFAHRVAAAAVAELAALRGTGPSELVAARRARDEAAGQAP